MIFNKNELNYINDIMIELKLVMQMHVHNQVIAKQWLVCTVNNF